MAATWMFLQAIGGAAACRAWSSSTYIRGVLQVYSEWRTCCLNPRSVRCPIAKHSFSDASKTCPRKNPANYSKATVPGRHIMTSESLLLGQRLSVTPKTPLSPNGSAKSRTTEGFETLLRCIGFLQDNPEPSTAVRGSTQTAPGRRDIKAQQSINIMESQPGLWWKGA